MQGLNVDVQMLRDSATFIGTEAGNYDTNLSELYTKFSSLGNCWSGPDYDAANSVMTQNKQPLFDLGITLHNIANALNSTADDYENKINRSAAQFEE